MCSLCQAVCFLSKKNRRVWAIPIITVVMEKLEPEVTAGKNFFYGTFRVIFNQVNSVSNIKCYTTLSQQLWHISCSHLLHYFNELWCGGCFSPVFFLHHFTPTILLPIKYNFFLSFYFLLRLLSHKDTHIHSHTHTDRDKHISLYLCSDTLASSNSLYFRGTSLCVLPKRENQHNSQY